MKSPASTLGRRPYQRFPARTARAGERGGLYGKNLNLSWGREGEWQGIATGESDASRARRALQVGFVLHWRAVALFGAPWQGLARVRKEAKAPIGGGA
jgi:hypothetical protein